MKQKKFIASDNEEDSGGSLADSNSAHSRNGDNDSDNDHNDAEPVPHRTGWRCTRDSGSVAQGATSPVKVDSLQATVSATSSTHLPTSHPDYPLVQQALSAPAQPAHMIISPVHSPQLTRPITTHPAIIQYLSLPHLFLPDSGSPVGFLLDSYWISTNFLKRHFHIFFHFPSYWTPTRFLLDSHWTPIGLQLNLYKVNAMDSYWIPNHFV